MAGESRSAVVETLVERIVAIDRAHPVRIGIDGRSAAGKSTLADELAVAIERRSIATLRASIDDFHKPGHKLRSIRGEWTAETRYHESYDYAAFERLLLDPLGGSGDCRCRPTLFDSFNDVPFPEQWLDVSADTVVLVDGVYLQRPELAVHWDLVIWLDVDWETSLGRRLVRDLGWVDNANLVRERHLLYERPAQELYEREVPVRELAQVVIDNRNLLQPNVLKLN